eukprot:TRINITY_DN4679_c0_g4_i5.p1 TRINITY_DN4679_c0_g4~~TRINITY_DN4679_c0_g4_i5.p1  ORF type:complete len:337 (+),score=60.44 TRINITY_DN4679_c0_g4_i5:73-1083(+)
MCIRDRYQEYFFMKAACLTQSFTKPLLLNYRVEISPANALRTYIEVIFEESGVSLDKVKDADAEVVFELMKQSANALRLMHGIGRAHLDIKPSVMKYDRVKGLLKFADMGYAFKAVLPKAGALTSILKSKELITLSETPTTFDVFSWALTFFSILSHKDVERKLSDYADFIKLVDESLGSAISKNPNRIIRKLLLNALKERPEERPGMEKLIKWMKKFETVKLAKHLSSANKNPKGKKILTKIGAKILAMEKLKDRRKAKYVFCSECSKSISERVELECEHSICKDCLIQYALQRFIEEEKYRYSFVCKKCKELKELISLVLYLSLIHICRCRRAI